MPANWTAPALYTTGQLVTAADMNLISDNLNALKTPPTALATITGTVTTTSTIFADIPGLTVNLTTNGGDVLIFCSLSVQASGLVGGVYSSVDVAVDGVRLGNTHGLISHQHYNDVCAIYTIATIRQSLAAGAHTIKTQWKQSGSLTLSLNYLSPVNCQLWAREIS
jgi:hypothetical protein